MLRFRPTGWCDRSLLVNQEMTELTELLTAQVETALDLAARGFCDDPEEVLAVSAKTGEGIDDAPLRAVPVLRTRMSLDGIVGNRCPQSTVASGHRSPQSTVASGHRCPQSTVTFGHRCPQSTVTSGHRCPQSAVTFGHHSQVLPAVIRAFGGRHDDAVRAAPLRCRVLDARYDATRGAIAVVQVVDGSIKEGDRVAFLGGAGDHAVQEIGLLAPAPLRTKWLPAGCVGYLVAGLRDVREARIGDTLCLATQRDATEPVDPLPEAAAPGLYSRRADMPPTNRGDAAAGTRINPRRPARAAGTRPSSRPTAPRSRTWNERSTGSRSTTRPFRSKKKRSPARRWGPDCDSVFWVCCTSTSSGSD